MWFTPKGKTTVLYIRQCKPVCVSVTYHAYNTNTSSSSTVNDCPETLTRWFCAGFPFNLDIVQSRHTHWPQERSVSITTNTRTNGRILRSDTCVCVVSYVFVCDVIWSVCGFVNSRWLLAADEQSVFISEVESSSVSSRIPDLTPASAPHECVSCRVSLAPQELTQTPQCTLT